MSGRRQYLAAALPIKSGDFGNVFRTLLRSERLIHKSSRLSSAGVGLCLPQKKTDLHIFIHLFIIVAICTTCFKI